MPKKRKRDNDGGLEEVLKSPPTCCILHVSGIQHLDFTPLSKVKGSATEKLAQLHSISDRRLREPHDSSYRMEDVCNQIPVSLAGVDLEALAIIEAATKAFTKKP